MLAAGMLLLVAAGAFGTPITVAAAIGLRRAAARLFIIFLVLLATGIGLILGSTIH